MHFRLLLRAQYAFKREADFSRLAIFVTATVDACILEYRDDSALGLMPKELFNRDERTFFLSAVQSPEVRDIILWFARERLGHC